MTRTQEEIYELSVMWLTLYRQKPTLLDIARLRSVEPYAIKMQLTDLTRELIK